MSPTVRAVMIAVLAGASASACDDAPAPPPAMLSVANKHAEKAAMAQRVLVRLFDRIVQA